MGHGWIVLFFQINFFPHISGAHLASILEHIELEVSKVKEEAFSRKEILEKVEKWMSAREEEEWLEEYNQVVPKILNSQQKKFMSIVLISCHCLTNKDFPLSP